MEIKKIRTLREHQVNDVLETVEKGIGKTRVGHERLGRIVVLSSAYFIEGENDREFYKKINLSKEIKEVFKRVSSEVWDLIVKLNESFDKDILLAVILNNDINREISFKSGDFNTPKTLIDITKRLLEIKEGESVLDICSGEGSFILDSYVDQPKASYTGIEIFYEAELISEIRNYILGANWNLNLKDSLSFEFEEKYDKILSDSPFGLKRFLNDSEQLKALSEFTGLEESKIKTLRSEWTFALVALMNMKDTGKVVSIQLSGTLWERTTAGLELKKWLVENGYIETIISLPEKLLTSTMIPVNIVVLSRGNKTINMVDATEYGVKDKKRNIIPTEEIDEIVALLGKNTENSEVVNEEKIKELGYDLYPLKYTSILTKIEDGEKLGNVTLNIKRGAQMKASELDALKSKKPTKYRYITLSEINDGFIEIEGNYLKEIPEDKEKYCLKNNFVVVSKTASPFFKSAIVEMKEDEKILVTSNIYIIEADEEKINPQYLQAFLMSETGKTVMKTITAGQRLPVLGISDLRDVVIPTPEREIQDKIAVEYMAAIDQMRMFKLKYNRKKLALSHIYEEASCAE